MSKLLFGLCLLVALASAAVINQEGRIQAQFVNFLKKHNAVYDVNEMFYRYTIFKSNLAVIEAHNEKYHKGESSFTMGVNRFADRTNAEYRQLLGLKRKSQGVSTPFAEGRYMSTIKKSTPASWDWRTKGAVTDVKDQGQCGSCWAFSATAAMEGAWFQHSTKLISMSEQLCVDCVNNGADTCDAGGEMHDCYLQVIQQGGDETEEQYPYTATSGSNCLFDKQYVVATFSSYVNVTQGDENALMTSSSQSVVSVGIDASQMSFQFYSGGVYDEKNCKNGWFELDHGVTVVGYGTKSKKDYWIVKNSWGGDWGLSGYILMSRNKNNQCGIATDATVPIV